MCLFYVAQFIKSKRFRSVTFLLLFFPVKPEAETRCAHVSVNYVSILVWEMCNESTCPPVEGGKGTACVSSGCSWTRLRTKSWRRKSCWRTFSLTTLRPVRINVAFSLRVASAATLWLWWKPLHVSFASKPWSWMSWTPLWRRRTMTWGPWKSGTKCTWRKLAMWVKRCVYIYVEVYPVVWSDFRKVLFVCGEMNRCTRKYILRGLRMRKGWEDERELIV